VVTLCSDWNAKIGKTSVEWQDIIGNYGFGERNERRERLLQFAMENDLVVANTLFKHKDCRKWTWRSPDSKSHNMIDLVLIKRALQQCRSFQGADIDSDHSLVLFNIKIRPQKQKHKSPKPRRNMALLQTNIAQQYRQQLDETLNSLEAVEDLDKRTDILVAAINSSIEEVLPVEARIRNRWISKETLEKVKQKRKLKLQRDQSELAEV